jgi:hypothetical protein
MRIVDMFFSFEYQISAFLISPDALNIYFLLSLFYTVPYLFNKFYFTSFKCLIISIDFPKPSCCSANSCSKAAWKLQIAFLKPPGNLC